MKKLFPLVIFLLMCTGELFSKVLIITHSYNRPDFIEWQNKMFKKFMQDDYEYVVFSDAPSEKMNQEIVNTCKKCDVKCIRIPQEIHQRPYLPRESGDPLDRPNIRHANCVQYSMDTLGFNHDGPVVVLDSDMFLIRPLSVINELKSVDILAIIRGSDGPQGGVSYLCPILIMFAMDRLPQRSTMNFNCGKAGGAIVDSGGNTHYYLKAHPELKVINVSELWGYRLFCEDRHTPDFLIDRTTPVDVQVTKLKEFGFHENEINFLQKKPHTISFIFNHCFLHYRAGSNYDNQTMKYEQQKTKLIGDFLEEFFAGK